MENTGRFSLPMIMPSQAQKHVTHNEALTLIDGLMHLVIKTFGETIPPVTAQIDNAFVVGASATGAWFGRDGNIAFNTESGWRFVAPRQGTIALNAATADLVIFDQGVWKPLSDALDISNLPQLGVNTSASAINRLAVRSNAALLTAIYAADSGNGDIQLKLNKEVSVDTGSLLFQTGFSGRAEMGLAGDDDFSIKVSPDGSAWNEALRIDRTSGTVTLRANSVSNAALAGMPTARFKGRTTAGAGAPEDLTGTQATALLNNFSTTLKGLAPASGGGTANFLRADGAWAAPAAASVEPNSNAGRFYAFHDCMSAVNTPDWAFTVTGTGVAHSQIDFTDNNSIGALRLALGTVATNRGSITSPVFTVFQLGQGLAKWASRIRLNTLSNTVDTWSLRSGFIDNSAGESVDGAFFRYTDGVNGGKFQAVTRSNSIETAVDTLITATINTTYKMEIEVNAAGTSADFRINGALVAAITTNIPTVAGRELGYGLLVMRTLGTAAINAYDVDFVMADLAFSTAR